MPEENVKYITTLKEIRVMNDPYRREILTAMALIDKPATAKEIADFMGEPPSKINYHVGIIYKYGYIDLDHTETINGIIAKFYSRSKSVFKIKMEGKNAQTKEMAALRDIVASTFDTARDIFIAQIARSAECEDDGSKKDNEDKNFEEDLLFSRKVYMSEQDLKEIIELVDRLADSKKEGKKLYNFFTSYVEIKNEAEKNNKKRT